MGSMSRRILVVEDDIGLQKQLRWGFSGFDVLVANDRKSAMRCVRECQPEVVLLDFGLPPDPDGVGEGVATLKEILKETPYTKVIMVTGNDERRHALTAIGLGAYDFYTKPIDIDELKFIVERARNVYDLEAENRELARKQLMTPLPGLVAASQKMLEVCRVVEKVAPSDITTLLQGESGTGKELLARALHDLSSRSQANFVAINCAAIPESLLESELFGYEKGAFTGAVQRTIGRIEHAQNGTLFLDEVGDLPMSLQAKLLRFLQEKTIERLGGRNEIVVDIRVVAATHQDLKTLIKTGKFREDLYYRLSQMVIEVPPLRERPGDAAAIANSLFTRYVKELGKPRLKLSSGALLAIENYNWPGNIRELENRLKQVAVMSDKNIVEAEDLGLPTVLPPVDSFSLAHYRERAERQALERALGANKGNISRAARMLKVSRPTLYDLMNKYNYRCQA